MTELPSAPLLDDATAPRDAEGWHRLDRRMLWVDALVSLLAATPTLVATVVLDIPLGNIWPVVGAGAVAVLGAAADVWRWVFTRYRVTDDHVEVRTGLLVRAHRSVQRDRIRSVDVEAKLRHRLSGMRIVKVGAGQQSSANESAIALDAVRKADAEMLQRLLRRTGGPRVVEPAATDTPTDPVPTVDTDPGAPRQGASLVPPTDEKQVLATFRLRWVVHNVFNVWAYVMAAGVLWGGYWLLQVFGLDVAGFVAGLLDWERLGIAWTIALAITAVGVVGVVGLAISFVLENGRLELARVPGEKGTLLRTRKGLLTTREVNRDDTRLRGISIGEPLLWRWMRTAGTNVITTGLSNWSTSEPTAVLPRTRRELAQRVAGEVLGVDPNPVLAPLRVHPRRALRRRVWWAVWVSVVVAAVGVWLARTDVVPGWAPWVGAGLLPLSLLAAVVAYRALGHAVVGPYVVVRSGLSSRTTSALQRSAVSTIAVRQSLLQRRLGLATVSAMTSAGWGAYEAPDLALGDAVRLAHDAAPGLLDEFVEAA